MDEISIRAGDYEAGVTPGAGGALSFLRWRGRDLLRPGAPEAIAADPRNAACYPCVPYFGRVVNGLDAFGRDWSLAPTLPACEPVHALHGEGWISPWRVAHKTVNRIELDFEHRPAPGRFPFAYAAEQWIELSDRGLSLTLRLRNRCGAAMPASPALHPFFRRDADTRVVLTAGGVFDPASGFHGAAPAHLDFRRGAALPDGATDHSCTDVSGAIEIRTDELRIMMETDAPNIHLFAPAGENHFCLEPLSDLPGDLGNTLLPAGETMEFALRLAASEA